MLYLGIDQHKRQLTVNLRSEDGSVILKRQVSTEWERVRAFFADLAGRFGGHALVLDECATSPVLVRGTAYGISEETGELCMLPPEPPPPEPPLWSL